MSLLTHNDIEQLRRDNPVDQVAGQWVTLHKQRQGQFDLSGPCPIHTRNSDAKDATAFACDAEEWVCYRCGRGDVFRLVALRNGLDPKEDFRRAIALGQGGLIKPWAGEPSQPLSAEEEEALREARAERQASQEAERNEWRDAERRKAWDLYYKYGVRLRHPRAKDGRAYLRARLGCDVPPEILLRVNDQARFYQPDRPKARELHRGPALLGAIRQEGRFIGVHQTFIDLARPPKCKALIIDAKDGGERDAKKVRGSQKGGHIELTACEDPRELVLGEGIEKVLALYCALRECGRDVASTAFWSAMNLDNLGGKHKDSVPHPTLVTELGRARRVPGPEPDMDAPAIVIPASVERLVLLGDSTSDPFTTQCVLARAAARFIAQRQADPSPSAVRDGSANEKRPLEVVCAWSPAGLDFDDVLREAA